MPVASPPVHVFWKPHCFSFSTKNILYFISQFSFLRIDISAGSGVRDANMIEWCEGSSSRPTNMVSSSSSPSYNQKPSPTIMVSSSSPSYNKKPSPSNMVSSSSSPSYNQKPSPTNMVSFYSPSYNQKPSTTNMVSSSPSYNQKPSTPIMVSSSSPSYNHPQPI